eukprot:2011511-Amphidinium_carterae.1
MRFHIGAMLNEAMSKMKQLYSQLEVQHARLVAQQGQGTLSDSHVVSLGPPKTPPQNTTTKKI